METKTSKNIISWGQLFLLIGVFVLFLYALTVRVNFNPKTDVVLEGYVFVGSELKSYTGQDKDVTLPTSYSFGEPVYYSGKTTFNSQYNKSLVSLYKFVSSTLLKRRIYDRRTIFSLAKYVGL